MSMRAKLQFGALVCGLLVSTAGCGAKSNLDTVVVKGKVTYHGAPLENGRVRFVPTNGTKGMASIAYIEKGGVFEMTARGGVPVGTHRVEVISYRNVPGAKPYTAEQVDGHPELHVGDIPQEQYIPAQYNKDSKVQVTIEPGSKEVEKDINLT